MSDLRQLLTRSVAEEFGLNGALADRLARLQAKSLARIIANLINANEPLLIAEADGTVLSVDERGGTGGFVVTVQPAVPARTLDEELDAR